MVLMGSFILPSSQDTRGRKADSSLFLDRSLRRHDPDQVRWVSAESASQPLLGHPNGPETLAAERSNDKEGSRWLEHIAPNQVHEVTRFGAVRLAWR